MKSERRKLGREERNIAYQAGVSAGYTKGRRAGYTAALKHYQTAIDLVLLAGVLWLIVSAIPDCQDWARTRGANHHQEAGPEGGVHELGNCVG